MSLHGQLYGALDSYKTALRQANQLSAELEKAMETLSRRVETMIDLVHKIECPHPAPTPEDIQRVDKHYGVSWDDIAEQANVSWQDVARSYSPGVPQSHVAQCPKCGGTFQVTNPEKLAEVDGLCQRCWKNTQAT